MGILKVITKSKANEEYLLNACNYVDSNNIKSHTDYCNGFNINPHDAYTQMMAVKKYFHKTSGNQLVHFIVSFNKDIDTMVKAKKVSREIAKYYADRYQIVYAIHYKKRYNEKYKLKSIYHTHIILNSVNFVDGKMFADNKSDIYSFCKHIQNITEDFH